jgi:hypothetical protein
VGSANSDFIKGIISGFKLSAAWTFLAAIRFGVEVATAIWKPLDDFYPFNLLLWGAATVVMVFAIRGNLARLTFAVPLPEADSTRMKTHSILLANFGIACVSFCLGLCLVSSKRVGGIYTVAAIAFGVLLLLIGFLMYRAIKRLGEFVTPLGGDDKFHPQP